jgi:hypothetical protein
MSFFKDISGKFPHSFTGVIHVNENEETGKKENTKEIKTPVYLYTTSHRLQVYISLQCRTSQNTKLLFFHSVHKEAMA